MRIIPNTPVTVQTLPLRDEDGDLLTGSSIVYLRLRKNSNGHWYDWNDSTFKASGWTTLNNAMSEADSTNAEGVYEETFTLNQGNVEVTAYIVCADAPLSTPQLVALDYNNDWAVSLSDIDTELEPRFTDIEDKVDIIDTNVDAILVDTGITLPAIFSTMEGKIDVIDGNVDAILVDTSTTLDGKINTIDTNVDSVLVDTGTTIPGTLTTIEGKIDTVDSNVDTLLIDVAAVPANVWTVSSGWAEAQRDTMGEVMKEIYRVGFNRYEADDANNKYVLYNDAGDASYYEWAAESQDGATITIDGDAPSKRKKGNYS